MPRTLSVVEPHPSVPQSGGYVYGGRGGAGNYKHYKSTDLTAGPSATGPASRINLIKPFSKRQTASQTSPTYFASGRGGAGNMFRPSTAGVDDERVFQFDEEMVKKRETQAVAPVYHIGRGGAGNYADESRPQRTARTDSGASVMSSSSEGSTDGAAAAKREGVMGKIARRFS